MVAASVQESSPRKEASRQVVVGQLSVIKTFPDYIALLRRTGYVLALAAPIVAQAQGAPELAEVTVVGDTEATGDYRVFRSSTLAPLGDLDRKNTPFSVNVFTSRLMENQQARSPLDVLKNDASVVSNTNSASLFDGFVVRGFSLNNLANFRQDGAQLNNLSNVALETKERVELLKGLSGVFYGVSAPGGIVNYVTKRPTAAPLTTLTAGYGNDSMRYGHVDISRRFGGDDQFGVRLNLAHEGGDTAIDGINLRRNVTGLSFDWAIHPTLRLQADVEYQSRQQRGMQPQLLLATAAPVPVAPNPVRSYGQPWERYDSTMANAGVRMIWDPSAEWSVDVALRNSDTRRDLRAQSATLNNASGDLVGRYTVDALQRFQATSGHALVRSRFATGTLNHEVTAGYTTIDAPQYRGDFVMATLPRNNLYSPVPLAQPVTATSLRGYQYQSLQQDQNAWSLTDFIEISPQWSVLAGVRHVSFDQYGYNHLGVETAAYKKRISTPMLAAVFKPTSSVSLYTSYVQGLESGGTAPSTAANAGETLPPIESKQAEVGVKIDLTERLQLDAALFRINKGLEFLDASTNRLVQNGLQRHDGFEVSVRGQLSSVLSVIGGVTLLDAKALETGSAATRGKRPTNVPKATATASVDWRVPGVDGLNLIGGIRHVRSRFVDATNTKQIPAFSVIDIGARLQLTSGKTPITLRANIDNVANKGYWAGVNAGALSLGAPRTVRLSASADF